jgi:hypothetical protein
MKIFKKILMWVLVGVGALSLIAAIGLTIGIIFFSDQPPENKADDAVELDISVKGKSELEIYDLALENAEQYKSGLVLRDVRFDFSGSMNYDNMFITFAFPEQRKLPDGIITVWINLRTERIHRLTIVHLDLDYFQPLTNIDSVLRIRNQFINAEMEEFSKQLDVDQNAKVYELSISANYLTIDMYELKDPEDYLTQIYPGVRAEYEIEASEFAFTLLPETD